jgi:hypothetical protein
MNDYTTRSEPFADSLVTPIAAHFGSVRNERVVQSTEGDDGLARLLLAMTGIQRHPTV